jgi:predicted Zn finger-like uncharacterized protein
MIINCPHCQAKYEVPLSSLSTRIKAFRCSSCGYSWTVQITRKENDRPPSEEKKLTANTTHQKNDLQAFASLDNSQTKRKYARAENTDDDFKILRYLEKKHGFDFSSVQKESGKEEPEQSRSVFEETFEKFGKAFAEKEPTTDFVTSEKEKMSNKDKDIFNESDDTKIAHDFSAEDSLFEKTPPSEQLDAKENINSFLKPNEEKSDSLQNNFLKNESDSSVISSARACFQQLFSDLKDNLSDKKESVSSENKTALLPDKAPSCVKGKEKCPLCSQKKKRLLGLFFFLLLGGSVFFSAPVFFPFVLQAIQKINNWAQETFVWTKSVGEGLEITEIVFNFNAQTTPPSVLITGKIKNDSDKSRLLPALLFVIIDGKGQEVQRQILTFSKSELASGQITDFKTTLSIKSSQAQKIEIRFTKEIP